MGLGSIIGGTIGGVAGIPGRIFGAVAGNNVQKKLKKKPVPSIYDTLEADAKTRLGAADTNLAGSRGAYEGFDPMAYMKEAAGAAYGELAEQDQTRYAKRGAANNARGFFGSPVGRAADSRYFDKQLSQALAGLSMDAGRMDMGRRSEIYQSDRDDSRYYHGTGVDLAMTREGQRLQDKASKRGMWGQIVGGIASMAPAAMAMFSDEQLKTDIRESEEVLPRARRLRAVGWEWNNTGKRITGEVKGKRRSGVVAQELEREFPELVHEDETGFRKVDYGGLSAVLVKAIGELDAKVERISSER